MKILLGVDSSERCQSTVACLSGMPWPEGTRVILVSAVTPEEHQYAPEPHVVASAAGALAVIEADHVKTHEALLARMERSLRDAGFEVESRMCLGDPGHALVEAARKELVDLVVVGCHRHRGFGRRLMGTVASHVVTHAPCDVLVVKREASRA